MFNCQCYFVLEFFLILVNTCLIFLSRFIFIFHFCHFLLTIIALNVYLFFWPIFVLYLFYFILLFLQSFSFFFFVSIFAFSLFCGILNDFLFSIVCHHTFTFYLKILCFISCIHGTISFLEKVLDLV